MEFICKKYYQDFSAAAVQYHMIEVGCVKFSEVGVRYCLRLLINYQCTPAASKLLTNIKYWEIIGD